MKKTSLRTYTLLFVLFLTACTATTQVPPTATQTPILPEAEFTATHPPEGTPTPFPTNVRIEEDITDYPIPNSIRLDAIAPIYDPIFATAAEALIEETELVMGVAIDGQAKAYPVNVLRFREIVNDELAGWPILVTW